jgi:hypothetical protein
MHVRNMKSSMVMGWGQVSGLILRYRNQPKAEIGNYLPKTALSRNLEAKD